MLVIISDRVGITYADGVGGRGGVKNRENDGLGKERHIYGAGFLLTLEPRGDGVRGESFFPSWGIWNRRLISFRRHVPSWKEMK